MTPRPDSNEPAGNIEKLQPAFCFKKSIHLFLARLKKIKFGALHFMIASAMVAAGLLAMHNYTANYVYVVYLGDHRAGVAKEAKEVDIFVRQLTARCADFYGMEIEPSCEIELVKEFKPYKKLSRSGLESQIRQHLKFETEAFMLTVNGEPLVALRAEEDLSKVSGGLEEAFGRTGKDSTLISADISDELALVPCVVDPDEIYSAEAVVEMVTGRGSKDLPVAATVSYVASNFERSPLESRQLFKEATSDILSLNVLSPAEMMPKTVPARSEKNSIRVKTVEEFVVKEAVAFETEIEYEEEMWIVQSEVVVEGEEGEREILYRVTKENGLEVSRLKVQSEVVKEPVTQLERHGTAKVPSVGTGEFVWPVEGGGEVTPGRGFSNYHTGIDIHTATGTNILAADDAVVWFSGRGGSQGNYLILFHGSFWTLYLHNSENLVEEGAVVEQGDVIAKAGSTGRSTGPHLHFEVRLDDGTGEWHTYYQHKPIDPLQFFRP